MSIETAYQHPLMAAYWKQLDTRFAQEAKELAENNPLGMDEVFLRVRERILGRYLTCRGREIDQRMLVSECSFLHFDPGEIPPLLNRAGGSS